MKEHRRMHLDHILGTSDGNKAASIQVVAHTGGMRGSLFSVFTFPETQSAVVTMTNGRDFGDASDFTAQILIQALFDLKPERDLSAWAKKEAKLAAAYYREGIEVPWNENRRTYDSARDAILYAGDYHGFNDRFKLSVVARPDSDDATTTSLSVVFNHRKASEVPLVFYKRDVYSFYPDGEDAWKIYQLGAKDYKQLLLEFAVDDVGVCSGLRWRWDKDTELAWFRKVL
jgi:hypothetical protein